MRIKDLPSQNRPRERFLKSGPGRAYLKKRLRYQIKTQRADTQAVNPAYGGTPPTQSNGGARG